MRNALKNHCRILMEAAGLGIFMVSASVFTILLYHPASPTLQVLLKNSRGASHGTGNGMTAIAIIYSPWANSRVLT